MGGAATGCRGRAALPWGLPALPVLLPAGAAPGLLGGGIPPASLTAPRPGGGGIRTDQAPLPITDQILTARAVESLQHQLPVLGLAPLHQCPLEGLVVGRAGDEDRLHGAGVQAGVPHAGGQGAGGGIEVLHLLRHVSLPVEPLRQLDRILQGAAGVGGDEVGDQVLVLAANRRMPSPHQNGSNSIPEERLSLFQRYDYKPLSAFLHNPAGLQHLIPGREHTRQARSRSPRLPPKSG